MVGVGIIIKDKRIFLLKELTVKELRKQILSSGLPFPSPGDRPDPGIKPWSPALQAESLPLSPQGSPDRGSP